MQQEQLDRGTTIPVFLENEIAHIQAYIRAEGIRRNRRIELLPLPDPEKGSKIFRQKRCHSCHPPGGGEGPDLGSSALDRTVSEISGILWNHSYEMQEMMRAQGITFPRFEGTEMADLISYLYFLSFVGGEGDPEKGEGIFRQRGCARCHAGVAPEAVDLFRSQTAADPMALSSAMWNHAPEMHLLMAEEGVTWPKFDPGDMGDLAAYLRKIAGTSSPEGP